MKKDSDFSSHLVLLLLDEARRAVDNVDIPRCPFLSPRDNPTYRMIIRYAVTAYIDLLQEHVYDWMMAAGKQTPSYTACANSLSRQEFKHFVLFPRVQSTPGYYQRFMTVFPLGDMQKQAQYMAHAVRDLLVDCLNGLEAGQEASHMILKMSQSLRFTQADMRRAAASENDINDSQQLAARRFLARRGYYI